MRKSMCQWPRVLLNKLVLQLEHLGNERPSPHTTVETRNRLSAINVSLRLGERVVVMFAMFAMFALVRLVRVFVFVFVIVLALALVLALVNGFVCALVLARAHVLAFAFVP